MSEFIGDLVFCIVILSIWTIFYKENPLYKAMSSMSVGLMLAFWLKGGINTLIKDVIEPAIFEFRPGRIVVLLLGLSMFLRFKEDLSFVSKWPIAVLAGVGTAIASRGAVSTMIVDQISASSFIGNDLLTNVNNLLIWVGVIATTVYFLFSFERGPVIGKISKIGEVYMMLAFGVVFGMYVYSGNVLTQMSYLLDYPGYYASAVAAIIIIADIVRRTQKKEPDS